LTEDKIDLYFKVFKATRGINVKDKLWLAFNDDESYDNISEELAYEIAKKLTKTIIKLL